MSNQMVPPQPPESQPEGVPPSAGGRLRAVWVKARDGAATPVVAREFGGHAIYDGCALLGKSAQLQAAADAIAAAPGAVVAEPLGAVVTAAGLLWPGPRGGPYSVSYLLHPKLDAVRRALVEQAIAHWAEHTRIRLHSRVAGEADYILFTPKDFCASAVGRQGGEQELWVSPDCTVGNIIHEIGHAVGLWHEHTRPDRDLYVEIAWTNVDPATRPNFTTRTLDGKAQGEYDYGSIMHYPANAFPIDPAQPTIVVPPGTTPIGQRVSLSLGDVAAVASLYP